MARKKQNKNQGEKQNDAAPIPPPPIDDLPPPSESDTASSSQQSLVEELKETNFADSLQPVDENEFEPEVEETEPAPMDALMAELTDPETLKRFHNSAPVEVEPEVEPEPEAPMDALMAELTDPETFARFHTASPVIVESVPEESSADIVSQPDKDSNLPPGDLMSELVQEIKQAAREKHLNDDAATPELPRAQKEEPKQEKQAKVPKAPAPPAKQEKLETKFEQEEDDDEHETTGEVMSQLLEEIKEAAHDLHLNHVGDDKPAKRPISQKGTKKSAPTKDQKTQDYEEAPEEDKKALPTLFSAVVTLLIFPVFVFKAFKLKPEDEEVRANRGFLTNLVVYNRFYRYLMITMGEINTSLQIVKEDENVKNVSEAVEAKITDLNSKVTPYIPFVKKTKKTEQLPTDLEASNSPLELSDTNLPPRIEENDKPKEAKIGWNPIKLVTYPITASYNTSKNIINKVTPTNIFNAVPLQFRKTVPASA